MGTTTETRITSTQAKDAIYKAHSINSSASEIDSSITLVKSDIKQRSNFNINYIDSLILGETNNESVVTPIILDFTKDFTICYAFRKRGTSATYLTPDFGLKQGTTELRFGAIRSATEDNAYVKIRDGATAKVVYKELTSEQNVVFCQVAFSVKSKEVCLYVNDLDVTTLMRMNYTLSTAPTIPLYLGKYNYDGVVSGSGIDMSNFFIIDKFLTREESLSNYKYMKDRWETSELVRKVSQYNNNEYIYRLINNINYDFKYSDKQAKKYINTKLSSALNVSFVGDSITHGVGVTNINKKHYLSLFKNYINSIFNIDNIGFVSINTLGSTMYHTASSSGFTQRNIADCYGLNGAESDGSVGATYSFTIATLDNQTKFKIGLLKQISSNCTFEVFVNGVSKGQETILQNGTRKEFVYSNLYNLENNGSGGCGISIVVISGTLSICGVVYTAEETELTINNYSQASRQIAHIKTTTVDDLVAKSDIIFWGLGHNDQYSVNNTAISNLEYLVAKCREKNIPIVFLDFVWLKSNNYIKYKLLELSKLMNNSSIYINFNDSLDPNGVEPFGTYLTSVLSAFADTAHPNDRGNKIIFSRLMGELKW